MQRIWLGLIFALGFLLCAGSASAQSAPDAARGAAFPTRPLTAIVPFPAGGPTDVIMRLLAEPMSKALGQRVIVENVAGAGGTLGSTRAARATADGHTFVVGNMGTHASAPALYPDLGYDPARDFVPIGMAAGTAIVIETRKDFPAKSLQEFVAQLKANASKLNEANAGVGSISHVTCLLLHTQLGVSPARVAYRGTAAALNDLIAGTVDYMCDQILNGIEQVKAGKIQGLAISSPQRSPALPDVPTTKEAGLPSFEVSAWNALFAPKGTPPHAVARLNDALSRALDDPTTRQRLLELGCNIPEPAARSPEWLKGFVAAEMQRWIPLLKAEAAKAKGT